MDHDIFETIPFYYGAGEEWVLVHDRVVDGNSKTPIIVLDVAVYNVGSAEVSLPLLLYESARFLERKEVFWG